MLKKGVEVSILPTPLPGKSLAVARTERGMESCVLDTNGPPEGCDGGDSYIELSRIEGNRFRVTEHIAFTSKSRPATNAYRSGWEAVFGEKRGGKAAPN